MIFSNYFFIHLAKFKLSKQIIAPRSLPWYTYFTYERGSNKLRMIFSINQNDRMNVTRKDSHFIIFLEIDQ